MSAIAGLLHLDGRPADPLVLERMAAALGRRAPDGCATWISGAVGFVHGLLATTPDARDERQPVVDCVHRLAVVLDGRIDPPSLASQASARHVSPSTRHGDAESLLRAYAQLGDAFADDLLGEFAFAIWDEPRQRLLCVRDPMGTQPLYYRRGAALFAFASEVGVLARCLGDVPPPNEGFVAEHLAGLITSVDETLFRDIFRLPAAHLLIADRNGIRVRRYWSPDPRRQVRYAREEEYVEELSSLLRDAVARRLRAAGRVGVMLSGGVDSSSVAGLAADLCRRGDVPASGIETFSLAVPAADESAYFGAVIERLGVTSHRVPCGTVEAGQLQRDADDALDAPMSPNAALGEPLRALASARGVRVMLTGIGGDEWLGTSASAYADLLRAGRLPALAARLRLDAAHDDFRGWRIAARTTLWPLVPEPGKRAIRRALGRGRAPSWIDPAFAARTSLADRLARHARDVPFPTCEQRDIWHEGTAGSYVAGQEALARIGATWHLEHRHPFHDRRIVELGLALPANQRWRAGRHKDLLRRAMAAYLPPAVAARVTNPDASHALVDAIELDGSLSRVETMTIARLGWVSAPRIRDLHERLRRRRAAGDPAWSAVAWTLWHVLSVELWVRAVLSRGSVQAEFVVQ